MALNWGGPQASNLSGKSGFAIPDPNLEAAEIYLESALECAKPLDGEAGKRARRQIEILLADVRERLGGPRGLGQARQNWANVWESLGGEDPTWARARAARKLGEVSLRLAHEVFGDTDRQARETAEQEAEHWLLRSAWEALGNRTTPEDLQADKFSAVSVELQREAGRPSTSWRFWPWSSSSSSSSISPSLIPSPRPELALLLQHLQFMAQSGEQPGDPPSTRSLVTSLLVLSNLLAKQGDLAASLSVAQNTSAFVNYLRVTAVGSRDAEKAPTTTTPITVTKETASEAVSNQLEADWLSVREAFISIYTGELLRALSRPEPDSLALLSQAIATANTVLSDLSPSSTATSVIKSEGLIKPWMGIAQDARQAGMMAANLSGLVHELGCGGGTKSSSAQLGKRGKEWCGGDTVARDFYVAAMNFASGLIPLAPHAGAKANKLPTSIEERPKGEGVDEAGWTQSWRHYARVRDRLGESGSSSST
jgi:hypothetical protein